MKKKISKKGVIEEKVNLLKFIKAITEKNYSVASKYLSQEIESKLKKKISLHI